MKEQKVFAVTIVEVTEKIHEGSGNISGIDREVLFDKKVTAVTARSAEAKAKKQIDAEYDEDALEVEVSECTFRG
jgi:hypothetical protein